MLKIKHDIRQQDRKKLPSVLSNLNNFHSLEVVDRVSETQLQVGENFLLTLQPPVSHIFGFSFLLAH